jgi:adenylate cyclase class 2
VAHPIEVERKRRLDASTGGLAERLTALGFLATDTTTETDTYYSRPDVDFMVTVECLRVRERGNFAEITYKPPSTSSTHSDSGVISKRETNVIVADGNGSEAQALLASLGMVELVRVVKKRTAYRRPDEDNVIVAVDTVAGAGVFIETEILADDQMEAAARLDQVERELGLDSFDVVSVPYRDLVMQATATR